MPKKKKNQPQINQGFYFTEEVQDAINQYNSNTLTRLERDRIFGLYIYPAFDKLCENIINTYKFYNTGMEFDKLKLDTLSFLVQKLSYYDHTKNTKAFSYFGTIAKRYLIRETRIYTRLKLYNDTFQNTSENDINVSYINEEHHEYEKVIKEIVIVLDNAIELPEIKRDVKYHKFLQGMLLIFDNIHTLEDISKKSTKYYLKKITGLNEKQISKYMNRCKEQYLDKIYIKYKNGSL